MDNMHVQPPSHQTRSTQPASSPAPDPIATTTQSDQANQAVNLNATISDGIAMTPENVAAAVINAQNDPSKPHFEKGELIAPDDKLM